jgi:hypothetical protein
MKVLVLISTWISIAHPKILASPLPTIEEYNQLIKGSIFTVKEYSKQAFTEAICDLLSNKNTCENQSIEKLRRELSLANVFQIHFEHYKTLKS